MKTPLWNVLSAYTNSETPLFGAVRNQTAKSMNPRSGSVETSFTVT
jgi:hypothetical protein